MVKTRNQISRLQINEEDLRYSVKNVKILKGIRTLTKTRRKIVKRVTFVDSRNHESDSKDTTEEPHRKKSSQAKRRAKNVTPEQLKQLIDSIVKDKTSLAEASRKSNMSRASAKQYYTKYITEPQPKITEPNRKSNSAPKPLTHDKIKECIGYIIDDHMSVGLASKKANISTYSGYRYYRMYLEDPNRKIPEPTQRANNPPKPVTYEKLKRLIDYIETANLSITAASKKVNMSRLTAYKYYKMYNEDPERKIPRPERRSMTNLKPSTHDQIKALIHYIEHDHLSVPKASEKVNMSETTARRYFRTYMDDPERKIPVPANTTIDTAKPCKQDQIKTLIHLIVHGKLSVPQASRKVKINVMTGYKYYRKYENDPERKIPQEIKLASRRREPYSNREVKKFFHYVVNDNMSIPKAAKKANIGVQTGYRYYNLYKEDQKIPEIKKKQTWEQVANVISDDQIKVIIEHIVKDNMSVLQASRKAKVSAQTAWKYYNIYKDDPKKKIPKSGTRCSLYKRCCTQEQVKELIGYIVDDKAPIRTASFKANMDSSTARKYYREYLNDPEHKIPVPKL